MKPRNRSSFACKTINKVAHVHIQKGTISTEKIPKNKTRH